MSVGVPQEVVDRMREILDAVESVRKVDGVKAALLAGPDSVRAVVEELDDRLRAKIEEAAGRVDVRINILQGDELAAFMEAYTRLVLISEALPKIRRLPGVLMIRVGKRGLEVEVREHDEELCNKIREAIGSADVEVVEYEAVVDE